MKLTFHNNHYVLHQVMAAFQPKPLKPEHIAVYTRTLRGATAVIV